MPHDHARGRDRALRHYNARRTTPEGAADTVLLGLDPASIHPHRPSFARQPVPPATFVPTIAPGFAGNGGRIAPRRLSPLRASSRTAFRRAGIWTKRQRRAAAEDGAPIETRGAAGHSHAGLLEIGVEQVLAMPFRVHPARRHHFGPRIA